MDAFTVLTMEERRRRKTEKNLHNRGGGEEDVELYKQLQFRTLYRACHLIREKNSKL